MCSIATAVLVQYHSAVEISTRHIGCDVRTFRKTLTAYSRRLKSKVEAKFHFLLHIITDVTVIGASRENGAVGVGDVMAAIKLSTVLISIMLAQNETG